jgi:pimeloyl-ACP methyl ester carboxylesterase
MNKSLNMFRLLALISAVLAFAGMTRAQEQAFRFAGTTCTDAAYLHCPDRECSSATVVNQGNVVEMKTRRTYFLDYPCDLKKGEKVTFILSLHGGGSYGNWQRHYFPLLDYVGKYRLVVATPNAPTRAWSTADDEYLQNIVNFVIEQVGKENIKAFWLAGHSQGGMTSNRIVRMDFFKDKVDGWLSLSGGRLGGIRAVARLSLRLVCLALLRLARLVVRRWPPVAIRLWPQQQRHCASFRPMTSRLSTRRASAKWMIKACQRLLTWPSASLAARGARQ